MTRQPFSAICPVVKHRRKSPYLERFFVSDLAEYLRVTTQEVGKYAQQKGIARWVRLVKGRCREMEIAWVSRRGARLVIEHFRDWQGRTYLAGKDWDAERARRSALYAARDEKKREAKRQARALGGLAKLIGGPVAPGEPPVQLPPADPLV